MKCPQCSFNDTRVIDSRPAEDGTFLRRRRCCDRCSYRFTTHERVLQTPLILVKKDGRREEFDAAKLRSGVAKACNKRSVSTERIAQLVEAVEASLRQEGKSEIASEQVGERVMEQLFGVDQVAYVRFASVYQRFDDVRRFAQLLERMSRRAKQEKRERSGEEEKAAGESGEQ